MAPHRSLNDLDACRQRLAAQFLTTRGPGSASEVVRALGAVQAQDYHGAKWALSQRTTGASEDEIERELDAGLILRTHVVRPTWHFVAPEDLRWMLALTAPRVGARMASYNKALELDGVVCSGPRRGKQFTYALLDERVPPAPALDRDQALLELSVRYFRTRGPATAQDFAWWSGLAAPDVERAVQIAGDEIEAVTLSGRTHWLAAGAPRPRKRAPSAHLLPSYDEYFIGLRDRSAIARRLGSAALVTGRHALIGNVICVDGQLVGGWKRVVQKDHVVVHLDLLTSLTSTEEARVARAAERFGTFVGQPVPTAASHVE